MYVYFEEKRPLATIVAHSKSLRYPRRDNDGLLNMSTGALNRVIGRSSAIQCALGMYRDRQMY